MNFFNFIGNAETNQHMEASTERKHYCNSEEELKSLTKGRRQEPTTVATKQQECVTHHCSRPMMTRKSQEPELRCTTSSPKLTRSPGTSRRHCGPRRPQPEPKRPLQPPPPPPPSPQSPPPSPPPQSPPQTPSQSPPQSPPQSPCIALENSSHPDFPSLDPTDSVDPANPADSQALAPTGSTTEDAEDMDEWMAVQCIYENMPGLVRPKPPKPKHAITIAVSSRALFDMVEENKIFEEQGMEKYLEFQLANENVTLKPGPAFLFVKALEHINARLRELYPEDQDLFDVVLMTNNHAQVGVRLINSINHYGLLIERFCLTGGKSPIGYLKAYLTNLYLSADSEKVQEAIEEGIASATMFTGNKDIPYCDDQLRVAFDGDAVLFSDESEQIAKQHGLERFFQHEKLFENKPLAQGPLKGFLEDLGRLQKKFYAKDERLLCPIRTYLVTARSAASSGARVLKTLRSWGLEIDEALFLAGAPKGPILVKIRPHIFFDDQMFHIEGAQKLGTIAAHVPYGVSQKLMKLKESPDTK
ncbi:cytosolic 5'-nucleotidase 1A-like isoform X1 [Tachyglossus aculeatus]|uniref:cytosolic 5'-nucleotidase 1A-like isoform X1 n=2 Tax=Tachyglossus aculeatus TaxID=9261 RepID=UPI0018F444F6|nr:cytosolic 5'-nucleotidase 1A-like isoform X1 [Tachyglossus aculeatus]